ncbi:hypothetical protein EAE89_16310 [Photorhabdus heterorhabditis]|uniref:Uncharacterized protein n=1 Tax=Photorhabdus heterorhabditis TaxID=880156 RepID=A0ABR5KGH4_9GAMM|nr:hypothetical protein AM629_02440 [Photorhabdus heterorhabditis]MBS9443207.1 hypothetical protein [Photorhabdus heterorhabditis]
MKFFIRNLLIFLSAHCLSRRTIFNQWCDYYYSLKKRMAFTLNERHNVLIGFSVGLFDFISAN